MRVDLGKFHDIHKGETCVVIGNGPSLKLSDIQRLPYKTFGSNQIYRLPFQPDYYSIVDKEMLDLGVERKKLEWLNKTLLHDFR